LHQQASMHIVENRIADDAFAVIVHTLNPIEQVSKKSLERILDGSAVNWQQITESHWSGSIEIVVADKNSGNYELLQNRFLTGGREIHPAAVVRSQEEVAAYIAKHPQAIGFVSFMIQSGLSEKNQNLALLKRIALSMERHLFVPHNKMCIKSFTRCDILFIFIQQNKGCPGKRIICFCIDSSGAEDYSESGYCAGNCPEPSHSAKRGVRL